MLWLLALNLIKKNPLNLGLVLEILAVERLIAILLHALRSQIKLPSFLLHQILLISYFVFNVRIIVLLHSNLMILGLVRMLQLTLINGIFAWRLHRFFIGPRSIKDSSVACAHVATSVHESVVLFHRVVSRIIGRIKFRKVTLFKDFAGHVLNCVVVVIKLVQLVIW